MPDAPPPFVFVPAHRLAALEQAERDMQYVYEITSQFARADYSIFVPAYRRGINAVVWAIAGKMGWH